MYRDVKAIERYVQENRDRSIGSGSGGGGGGGEKTVFSSMRLISRAINPRRATGLFSVSCRFIFIDDQRFYRSPPFFLITIFYF